MKKIKCQLCDGVWLVEENNLEKQKVCPYCASSVQGKVEFTTYDSLDKAIYGVVTKMGEGVLQNLRQLSGFMMDTAPNLKKEIRIFSKTVSDDYVIYIKNLFAQDIDAAEATIKKLRQLFIEEEGLSDAWADMICEGLYGATMYYNGIGIRKMINVTIEDIYEINCAQKSTISSSLHGGERINVKKQDDAENVSDRKQDDEEEHDILEHYTCSSSTTKVSNTYNAEKQKNILSCAEEKLAVNDIEAALEEYRLAANGGYVPAYNSIAAIYYSKQNFKKAWKWYLKAAEANDAEGQYQVGFFYLNGLHVMKNIPMAIKYFEKASVQNNNEAIIALADLYMSGIGYKKDEQKVVKLLALAAENGNTEAQYKLGQFYQLGNVVSKDIMEAAYWYQQAMTQGHPKAKQILNDCISEMPFTQRLKWKFH